MATRRRPAPQEDNLAPTRIISNLKNMFGPHTPEDELEPIEDISSVSSSAQTPVETDADEIMSILMPRKKNTQPPPEPETTTDKKPQTRIRIFTAATPEQLVEKVNDYLSAAETDPRLQNLTLVSTNYSSNNQGYSVMLTYRLT